MLKSYQEDTQGFEIKLDNRFNGFYKCVKDTRWLGAHIGKLVKGLPKKPTSDQLMHINGLLTLYAGTVLNEFPTGAKRNYMEAMIKILEVRDRPEFAGWIEFLKEKE